MVASHQPPLGMGSALLGRSLVRPRP
jgi:hypothetical protein